MTLFGQKKNKVSCILEQLFYSRDIGDFSSVLLFPDCLLPILIGFEIDKKDSTSCNKSTIGME